jgi:hypothetical protein
MPEHSVLAPVRQLERGGELEVYARCLRCGAAFRRDPVGVSRSIASSAFESLGPMAWMRPPWVAASDQAELEMSWDVVEHFFAGLVERVPSVAAVRTLLPQLREAGYGSRLRAGQSLSTLVLSRSREHGLREDQSRLSLAPRRDDLLRVAGAIGGEAVAARDVPPALTGWLADRVEALVGVPID